MAAPRDLVHELATTTALPEESIRKIDVELTRAGLRRMKGRGPRGVVQVNAQDAANLLIGACTAPAFGSWIAQCGERVSHWSCLRLDDGEAAYAGSGIASLETLPRSHTFGDGLAALINAAATRELDEAVSLWRDAWCTRHPRVSPAGYLWFGRVEFFLPWPRAEISIATGVGNFGAAYEAPAGTDLFEYGEWVEAQARQHGTADLRERRSISQRTILGIGSVIRGASSAVR